MKSNHADATNSPHTPSRDLAASDRVAPFWSQYVEEAEKYDEAFLEKDRIRMDGVLVFAGLFSAVTASFLISLRGTLQPNPSDTTNALLMMVVHSLDNSTFSGQTLEIPTWNGPTNTNILAQALGYAALSANLLASFGAVLGKRWLCDYATSKVGSLQERGSRRQQKLDALEEWRFEGFMAALPGLIQLALLLFGVALSISLWEINEALGYVVMSMTGLGVSFYLFVTVASLLHPTCPFHTPLSSTIQEATGIITKSVEELADYCAWRSVSIPQWQPEPVTSQANRRLTHLAVLFSLPIAVCTIPIMMLVLPCSVCILVIRIRNGRDFRTCLNLYRLRYPRVLKESFHSSACIVRDSARRARDFIHRTRRGPIPDLDHVTPRAVTWLLRTSTHPEKLIAALELVPDIASSEDFNPSPLGEGAHNLFARSIPEIHTLKDRALPLGKALVVLLCQVPLSTHSYRYIPAETLKKLDDIIQQPKAHWGSDVVFTLTLVKKLLRFKLGLEVHESELFPTGDVSQSLLVWFLGLLETMLRSDPSHAKRFFPEASQLYLNLDLKRANLSPEQQFQYCRTFEVFFNCAFGFNVEGMNAPDGLPAINTEAECLERILAKLETVNHHRLLDVQEHLIVTMTALSKLASTPRLQDVIRSVTIKPWMLGAFKEAVGKASESKGSTWLFVNSLVQLAADVDAFNPTRSGSTFVSRFFAMFSHGKTRPSPPRMDSKSLLSYLLNKAVPATSEQVVYALQIMHANRDEHLVLASNPHFVNEILAATEPSEVHSIRDVGFKVLVATCRSLLRAHDAKSLLALADHCDLAHFLHRGILHQDPPTMLKDLLRVNDKYFNEILLTILAPALGDPFDALLTKLHDEPNEIPEHDLCDLEMALVLSDSEGKKQYMFNHLDHSIDTMSLPDSRCTMALPLTTIVGWLLRRNGPLCSSEKSDWRPFVRPNFEALLFPAWGDPDVLGDNPQTLRLLLNGTEKWLSTYGCPGMGTSTQSPPNVTLARVQRVVVQLSGGHYDLPADLKRRLHKLSLSSEINLNREGKD